MVPSHLFSSVPSTMYRVLPTFWNDVCAVVVFVNSAVRVVGVNVYTASGASTNNLIDPDKFLKELNVKGQEAAPNCAVSNLGKPGRRMSVDALLNSMFRPPASVS